MLREASNIVGDLRGMASTGVRAVRTRLELLAIELKEEKAWLVRFVVIAIAGSIWIMYHLNTNMMPMPPGTISDGM